MGIDFDITSAPPDIKSIAATRAELAAERLRLRELNKRFLLVIIPTVAVLLCFALLVAVPYASRPQTEGGIVFIIAYSTPYLFFSIFVVGNTMHHDKVEVPRKALELAEEALQEGTQEDIGALFDACQVHAPLGTYQRQVESQGRALFKGELDAMHRWLDAHVGQAQTATPQ